MPGTNPTLISGYVAGYDFDAQTSSASGGASVSTLGSYTLPAGHTAPTMAATAANGRKAIQFAGVNALQQNITSLTAGTIIMVAKATSITTGGYPQDRSVLLGTTRTTAGGSGHYALWPFRQSTLEINDGGGGAYRYISDGYARFQLDKWFLSSFAFSAATGLGKSWKNYTADGTFTCGAGPVFNSLCVGADQRIYADTSVVSRPWVGYIARVVVFNAVLSDADREAATAYLIDYYDIDEYDTLIDLKTAPSGAGLEMTLSNVDGDAANVTAISGNFTYTLNGGTSTSVTPRYSNQQDWNGVWLEMPTALTPTDAVVVTVPAGSVTTTLGPCEARVVTATNRVGTRRLSQSLPSSRTLKLGQNFPGPGTGQFWSSTFLVPNLVKGTQPENLSGLAWDSLGRPTNAYPGMKFIISAPGDPSIPGSVYARLADGTYTCEYDPAGLPFTLAAHAGPPTTSITTGSTSTAGGKVRTTYAVDGAGASPCFFAQVTGSATGTPIGWAIYPPGVDPDAPGEILPEIVSKFAGTTVLRALDLWPINFSNMAQASHLTPLNYFSYGTQYESARRYSIGVARIEAWTGTEYAPHNQRQGFLVTTTTAHGLVDGQGGTFKSSGGAINVKLIDESIFPLQDVGTGNIVVLSPTTFVFYAYTGTANKAGGAAFVGTNATLSVIVEGWAPVEVLAQACNAISSVETCWINVPAPATEGLVRAMATALYGELDPGTRVGFEYSNECWNPGFSQYGHCAQMAVKLGLAGGGVLRPGTGYGRLARVAFEWFKDQWVTEGGDANDLDFRLGLWYGSPAFTTDVIAQLVADGKESLVTHATFAPYTPEHPLRWSTTDFSKSVYTVEVLMDLHEWRVDSGDTCPLYPQHRAILDDAGLTTVKLGNYEDNSAYLGFSADSGTGYARESAECLALAHHPRMAGYWYKRWADQQSHGVEESAIYTGYGNFGTERYGYGYTAYPFLAGGQQPVGPGDGSLGYADNRVKIADAQGKATLSGWDLATTESVRLWAWSQWNSGASGVVSAYWASVSSPRQDAVSSLAITFSASVTGFSAADLSLTRDGVAVTLTGVSVTGSGSSYTVTGLSSLTSTAGDYVLRFVASGSGVSGPDGGTATTDAVRSWTVQAPVSEAVPVGPWRERYRVSLRV